MLLQGAIYQVVMRHQSQRALHCYLFGIVRCGCLSVCCVCLNAKTHTHTHTLEIRLTLFQRRRMK
jgi:hypothetical protein